MIFRRKLKSSKPSKWRDGRLTRLGLFGFAAYTTCEAALTSDPAVLVAVMATLHDPQAIQDAVAPFSSSPAAAEAKLLEALKAARKSDRGFYEGHQHKISAIEKTVAGYFDGEREIEVICSKSLARANNGKKTFVKGMVIEEGKKLWVVLGHDQIVSPEKYELIPPLLALLCARFSVNTAPGSLPMQFMARMSYAFILPQAFISLARAGGSVSDIAAQAASDGVSILMGVAAVEGSIFGYRFSLKHNLDTRAYELAPDKDLFIKMLERAAREQKPQQNMVKRPRLFRATLWIWKKTIGLSERSPAERLEHFRAVRTAEKSAQP